MDFAHIPPRPVVHALHVYKVMQKVIQKAILRVTKYYTVLLRTTKYHRELQITTPYIKSPFRNERYYTKYYKVLQATTQYYSVQPSVIAKYYNVLERTAI